MKFNISKTDEEDSVVGRNFAWAFRFRFPLAINGVALKLA